MKKTLAALTLALAASAAHAVALPSHVYEFSGAAADACGGPAMALGTGSTYAGTGETGGLRFARNPGPTVAGAFADAGLYSLEMFFSLDDVSGYRRLVDWKNGTTRTACTSKAATSDSTAKTCEPTPTSRRAAWPTSS